MKILVLNYTFDASEKKITFTDYNPLVLERVLLITNVTDNVIIYNFSDSTLGGTAATNVLTLTYDTTGMSDTDDLQIFYEDGDDSMAVNDGGNTLTVDGTVAVSSIVAGVGATNIGKAEDATHTSGDTGVYVLAVRDDALAPHSGSDGDYESLHTDANGALHVNLATKLDQTNDAITVYGSDDSGTTKRVIKTDSGGAVQVDVESIAAGDNNIGNVDIASIAAGDNNIGNVDIASIAAGDNNIGNVDIASGTLTAVTTITNVVHVDDNSGNLSIDDGGNTITVDGTVNVAVGGQAPQLDDTDKLAVSIYGNGAAAGDTAIDVDADGHLQVDVLSGGGGGTLVTDNEEVNGADTGVLVLGTDGSNYQILGTDADGHLQVDVLSGGLAGTEYTEGDTDATITGGVVMWEDAADTIVATSASKPLPVSAPSTGFEVIQGTAGDLNCTEASASDIKTSVQIMDDWDDGNYCNVNLNLAGTDVSSNAGVLDAGTIRVTIATDDEVNNLLGTIDGDTSTIAGDTTSIDGKITACNTGAVVIDSGTVTTVTSITNDVNIADGGNTITVDGTVTADLSATDNAVLDSIKTNTDSLAVVGGGAEATALRVTLANDSTGVVTVDGGAGGIEVVQATAADLNCTEASAAAIKTAVEIMDDWDSGDTCKVTAQAGTAAIGKLLPPDIDITTHSNYARKYYTSAGAATDGIIWSPAAGKRWHVTSLYIQTSAAATVTLEDDKAGGDDPVWKSELAANSGVFMTFPEMYPMASGEDAADLIITTSAGNVYVTAVGYEV